MVRLMFVLAPVMCILSGIAVSSVLSTFMRNLDVVANKEKSKKQKGDTNYPIKNEVGFIAHFRCIYMMSPRYRSTLISFLTFTTCFTVFTSKCRYGLQLRGCTFWCLQM